MSGKLYVVGTPIGNLSDMTYRGVETLNSVDFICAEDTRVSVKILNHFGIKKSLVSYHEHSTKYVSDFIIERIINGESCAVVTDAGMPCISDPGEDLVKLCAQNGIEVVAVPGPSAAISALAISGLPTARFSFEGFLSTAKKQRYQHLESVSVDTVHTLIFYEAPHKLIQTLEDMLNIFGDRKISLCREITKLHEEVLRMTISEALKLYESKTPKGEYVLIVEPSIKSDVPEMSLEEAGEKVKDLISNGMKPTDACKEIAKTTGFKKSELYEIAIL